VVHCCRGGALLQEGSIVAGGLHCCRGGALLQGGYVVAGGVHFPVHPPLQMLIFNKQSGQDKTHTHFRC